jgi:microcompartment protein CcmK/EutM
MIFAKVAGTIISTKKSDTTEGTKYLLLQLCNQREDLKDSYVVALDLVGAGPGEMVIIAQGSSARQTKGTFEKPIDAVIAGIVDLIEENSRVVFRK